jgi:hypothetical protein
MHLKIYLHVLHVVVTFRASCGITSSCGHYFLHHFLDVFVSAESENKCPEIS